MYGGLVLLTIRVKVLPDLPKASGIQVHLSCFAGAVHGIDNEAQAQGGGGEGHLENFDKDSSTMSSDSLTCFFRSLTCFEHLSEGQAQGHLARRLLAP